MADDDPRCDFRDLRTTPKVPVVWSASRAVMNRVLFGLARAVSPAPYWVEVRARHADADEPGPADLGWIPPDRLFNLGELFDAPSRDAPPPVEFALISFLRDPSSAPITEAMKLGPLTEGSDSTSGTPGLPRVVAIANVDRVDQLWPETPRAMQTVVRAFLRAGLVPYFSTLRPTKRSAAADFVFQAVAKSVGEWRSGTLACEKAPDDASWKRGDTLPLTQFPTISAALSGRIEPGGS